MKHFVLNENRIFDLWEYIWLEISTALPHSNCQLHRAVYASLPPPLLFKKKKKKKGIAEGRKAGRASGKKPFPPLTSRFGSAIVKVVLICYLLNLITGRQPVQVVE